jgi:DNA topoisomerase-1
VAGCEHGAIRAELIESRRQEVGPTARSQPRQGRSQRWARPQSGEVSQGRGLAGLGRQGRARDDKGGRGPASSSAPSPARSTPPRLYRVTSIETKRNDLSPPPPFITSTLQQAASSRLGFGAQRTMRTAQQLYEGVDIPGEGPVGLITYMRTDSTHISASALTWPAATSSASFGDKYLPDKPNFFTSSNKSAQEAHEAIRPTNVDYHAPACRRALTDDQFRLYTLIWERFVACQMTQRAVGRPPPRSSAAATPLKSPCTFRATGRVLVFDGFMQVSGVPSGR